LVKIQLYGFVTLINKVVSVLSYALRHEDILGGGGIAPRILHLSTRRRWVFSFTPRRL